MSIKWKPGEIVTDPSTGERYEFGAASPSMFSSREASLKETSVSAKDKSSHKHRLAKEKMYSDFHRSNPSEAIADVFTKPEMHARIQEIVKTHKVTNSLFSDRLTGKHYRKDRLVKK